MSIQIYGYKSNKSLKEVFNLLKNAYNDFYQEYINHIKKEYVCYIYYRIDNMIVDKNYNGITIDDIKKEYYESIKNHKEDVVIGLYPYSEDVTFIQNFSSHIYWNVFHSLNFQSYHYSTSTEKPDDLTTKEWQKRYDEWEKIMPDWIPANNCVQYNPIIQTPNILEWEYEALKELFINFTPSLRLNGYIESFEHFNQLSNKNEANKWDNIIEENLFIISKEKYEGKVNLI